MSLEIDNIAKNTKFLILDIFCCDSFDNNLFINTVAIGIIMKKLFTSLTSCLILIASQYKIKADELGTDLTMVEVPDLVLDQEQSPETKLEDLSFAAKKTFPKLLKSPQKLKLHVASALAASNATNNPIIDPTLLLAMSYNESTFKKNTISRKVCMTVEVVKNGKTTKTIKCKRKTGRIKFKNNRREKPPNTKGTYYCGVLQVGGKISWKKCLTLVDNVKQNYLVAAKHLNNWYNDPKCRNKKTYTKRMTCALLGYGGGYIAINSRKSTYPKRCLSLATKIKNNFPDSSSEDTIDIKKDDSVSISTSSSNSTAAYKVLSRQPTHIDR